MLGIAIFNRVTSIIAFLLQFCASSAHAFPYAAINPCLYALRFPRETTLAIAKRKCIQPIMLYILETLFHSRACPAANSKPLSTNDRYHNVVPDSGSCMVLTPAAVLDAILLYRLRQLRQLRQLRNSCLHYGSASVASASAAALVSRHYRACLVQPASSSF